LKDNGLQKVAEFVSKTYDVPQNIVAEIMDARFFVMAKDAMAHHDMKIKSSEVLRPVKEAPKVIKRSVGKVTVTDSDIKQSNIRTLRANIRNSSSQAEKNNNLAGLWLEMKK
jgi:rRNA maturation endonuclease Nob1